MLIAPQLRWDHADLISYYDFTRCNLEQLLDRINRFSQSLNVNDSANNCLFINRLHDYIIAILNEGA